MTFTFYVPRTDAGGGDVLGPTTGDDRVPTTRPAAPPNGARPTLGTHARLSPSTLRSRAYALRQVDWPFRNRAPWSPMWGRSARLRETRSRISSTFQISDYFSFGDLMVTDVFSDGHAWQRVSPPRFPSLIARCGPGHSHMGGTPDLIIDLSAIGNDANPVTDGSTDSFLTSPRLW